MSNLIRTGTLLALVGIGVQGIALADSASTTGGLKIKSDDGNFEASIGGRIHFDGSLISPDDSSPLGISRNGGKNTSGFYFRRAFLTLAGKAYGWEYHVDEDFANGTTSTATATTTTISGSTAKSTSTSTNTGGTAAGFNDVWIAHTVFGNDYLYVGQHKPWRSLDEMASNNNLVFMERNILSANGLYGGRDFTQGLYYKYFKDGLWGGASFYTDGKAGSTTGRSFGGNARLAYAPIIEKTKWVHTGVTYSYDNVSPEADGFGKLAPGYSTWYAPRKGVGVSLVSFSGASKNNVNGGTGTAELAAAYGAFFFEGEGGLTHQWEQIGKTSTVNAYTFSLAYALTGETRPYSAADASFGGIKPTHSYGAVEVGARYDYSRNTDVGLCGLPVPKNTSATKCSVSAITVGVNYYVNPNVRFMLDYEHGEADAGAPGKDSPEAVMARTQFAF